MVVVVVVVVVVVLGAREQEAGGPRPGILALAAHAGGGEERTLPCQVG